MVTGDNCSFTCDPGYTLNASPQRECLPTSTWSGHPISCDPMLCSPPGGPENGFVVLPCNSPGPSNQEFMTTCTIQCSFGYLLEGPASQTCVLNRSSNTVEWTQAPNCTGTQQHYCLVSYIPLLLSFLKQCKMPIILYPLLKSPSI